jgi:hypothetical protein
VIPVGAVKAAGLETTLLEIYVLSRKGKDRFFQVFHAALSIRLGWL